MNMVGFLRSSHIYSLNKRCLSRHLPLKFYIIMPATVVTASLLVKEIKYRASAMQSSLCRWLVGWSYWEWVKQMIAKSAVEKTELHSDYVELKSRQRWHGQPFVRSDDSIVAPNVKEVAWVGQKTASAHYALMSSIDSIDDDGLNCC